MLFSEPCTVALMASEAMTETRTAPDALADWADKTPERMFLTQPLEGDVRQWTFRQAHDDAARFASALLGLDLAPGDKVAILSKNCAEWLIADVARGGDNRHALFRHRLSARLAGHDRWQ